MSIIEEKVSLTERLAGLAEEASELAQAALKYRRALDGKNPTPVDEDLAHERLLEEIADVLLYIDTLHINEQYVSDIKVRKLRRWIERLAK